MTPLYVQEQLVAPERFWFANTDMGSFYKVQRTSSDNSAFAHWLMAGRLFVTPKPSIPSQYNKALIDMRPGDPVFAYEDRVGFVAIGWVGEPKDLTDTVGGTQLYPNPTERVRSVAVEWDTSVTRDYHDVAKLTRVGGHGLQQCNAGTRLHTYVLDMLRELHGMHRADPDISEAIALSRIQINSIYGRTTRAQIINARVGQGIFRTSVLAREPVCRMTGIAAPSCLVASHIKPWAACVDGEHLDSANGLMLAPHVDHLFDTGRISFTDDGQIMVAPSLDRQILHAWHLNENANVGLFDTDQACYLAYHRRYVFGRSRQRSRRNLVGEVPIEVLAV